MADRDQQGAVSSENLDPGIDPEWCEDVAAVIDQIAEISEIPGISHLQIVTGRYQGVQEGARRVHRLSADDDPIPCRTLRRVQRKAVQYLGKTLTVGVADRQHWIGPVASF